VRGGGRGAVLRHGLVSVIAASLWVRPNGVR